MIVDDGIRLSVNLLGDGLGGSAGTHLAWGTDNTAVDASDSALGAEHQREAVLAQVDATLTPNGAQFRVGIQVATAGALVEYGLFTASSGGTMFLRTVEDEVFDVEVDDVLFTDILIRTSTDVDADAVTTQATCDELAKALVGDAHTRALKCALGQDDGTALSLADTNTALGTEVTSSDNVALHRAASNSVTVQAVTDAANGSITNGTLQVGTEWTTSNPFDGVREYGVVSTNTASTGVLYARAIMPETIVYRAPNTYEVEYRIAVARV